MANGDLVRQSNVGKDSVVFGPTICDVPLLPYERQLIETIGITEEEYRQFVAEAKRRGAVRPAAYDHIPDIVNDAVATPILINLAIGLVLTGVAYLLTPKPKMPGASKAKSIDLGDVTGPNRFMPSRGFDTLNELADYASPIPIIFGKYDEDAKIGGMLVTPKLVWSRILSHGTQQSAKLMFVVGEQGVADDVGSDGISAPNLEGIFLGNNPLDTLYEDFFAFYWKRDASGFTDLNRIRVEDRKYGTIGGPDKGEPGDFSADGDDVFVVPSNVEDKSESFCHAYSPTNNAQFGVYGAIPNGTGFRVNYETVSVPRVKDEGQDRQRRNQVLRRIKIVGDNDQNLSINNNNLDKIDGLNQEGKGRMYSPRMGITKVVKNPGDNESEITIDNEQSETASVSKGDRITFTISATKIPEDFYERKEDKGKESVEDINSSVEAEQIAADDALQVGEQFAIGNTVWVVAKRKLPQFIPDGDENQKITLECVSTDESLNKVVGIVSSELVINPDVGHTGDGKDRDGIGLEFFPITKIATGIVRNNRAAVVTEIGIRSRVFQRLNGLCAFNTTPTPGQLQDFDRAEVTVRTGTYTGTIERSSVFQVFVRQAGRDKNNSAFSFERMSPYFVVKGNKPVDQYNFIRFKHPAGKPAELEFKFVPIPAPELRVLSDDQEMILLSASISDGKSNRIALEVDVKKLGRFVVETVGFVIRKKEIRTNKELTRGGSTTVIKEESQKPSVLSRELILPDKPKEEFIFATDMEKIKSVGNVGTPGLTGAFTYEVFGNSDDSSKKIGQTRRKETREIIDDNRWLKVRWTVEKYELPANHYTRPSQKTTWIVNSAEIVGSSPGFNIGDKITFKRGLNSTADGGPTTAYSSDNPFRNHPDGTMTFSGFQYKITDKRIGNDEPGRQQAFYYEIFGSAKGKAIGEKSEKVIRTIVEGDKKIRFEMSSTVKAIPNGHFSGVDLGWNDVTEIKVIDDSETTDNWEKGDTFEDKIAVDISNPFYAGFDKVGFKYQITTVETIPRDIQITDAETVFEDLGGIADISFYRGLVQKSNESQPEHTIAYVNEILLNERTPQYRRLTIAGLSLKAGRNFSSLDQMRCWLPNGLHVKRLHPDRSKAYGNDKENGPSNLFTDLVFYLLTDQHGGAGGLLGMTKDEFPLINEDDFIETSKFLHKQKLFFNGAITDRTNVRQFIADTAPYFLCNFIIMDGKLSLKPAVPHFTGGEINDGVIGIEHLFTAGNILEDTYKVEYLRSEERRPFKAVMRYRQESQNKLPEERVMEVKIKGEGKKFGFDALPAEQFDLTQFCTSRDHALKVAKYFLSIRKFVGHTISFSTTVEGLNIGAGSYIIVTTASSPYSSAENGTIDSSGTITSAQDLKDGQYDIIYFKTGSEDIEEDTMTVTAGKVSESKFHDSIFTVTSKRVSQNVYVVEQLTFSQEGTVDIVASEHQCDDDRADPDKPAKLVSKLAKFLKDDDLFETTEN